MENTFEPVLNWTLEFMPIGDLAVMVLLPTPPAMFCTDALPLREETVRDAGVASLPIKTFR